MTANATPLGKILEEEIHCAEQLMRVLEREREAVRLRNLDAISETTELKAALVAQLNTLGMRRGDALQIDTASVESALHGADPSGRLQSLWRELMSHVKACQTLNKQNGLLLSSTHRTLKLAMEALGNGQGEKTVYGPEGQPLAGPATHSIAKV